MVGKAAGLPRARAEAFCQKHGVDYGAALSRAQLSQGELDAVLASGVFDPDFYLKEYPDVADAGAVPLLHYLEAGRFEARKASATFDPSLYLAANPKVASSGLEPFLHYVLVGKAAGLPRSRAEVFCQKHGVDYGAALSRAQLSQAELDAVLRAGVFDPEFYLQEYLDVADAGAVPLLHYL